MQQFSTPLPLAYLISHAAQLSPGDRVLEPSAGTGMLAAFARASGCSLILNELCPQRRGILAQLFPRTTLSGHNAEQLDDYLDPELKPTVVLINPPFSSSPKVAKRRPFSYQLSVISCRFFTDN
jgi:predicted RNA methylase